MKCKEIWLIDFNPTTGAEINKVRPAVIVSDDSIGALPLRVIVPITDWQERYNTADWHVKITKDGVNKLDKDSTADCFQIKSLSTARFKKPIGIIDDATFAKIQQGIKNTLGLA